MRLMLLAVGRMKKGPERDLLTRYCDRAVPLARGVGLTGFSMREIEEGRSRLAFDRKRAEAEMLAADLPPGSALFLLDEGGATLSSQEFADAIAAARDAGRPALALVVGGPDGLDPQWRPDGARCIAYGRATFPHQLVRIMAAEQIYRALTILAGHPYHRA